MADKRGRPFEPGNKFGRGRPRGSRNKEKSAAENLLQQYELHLIAKSIEMAMEGNTRLLNTLLNRVLPGGDRRVKFNMNKTGTIPGINRAFEQIVRAVGTGELAPAEGESVSRMLEAGTRILEKTDTALRVEKLELRGEREDQQERNERGDASSPGPALK